MNHLVKWEARPGAVYELVCQVCRKSLSFCHHADSDIFELKDGSSCPGVAPDSPPTLGVHVSDAVAAGDRVGG